MSKLHVEAEGSTRAAPEQVWALLADTASYASWGIWDTAEVQTPGTSGLVGLVRGLRFGRRTTVERIVEAEAPTRMTYTVVSGLPVRNYLAEVLLTARDGGTHVRWSADWDRTLLGWAVQRRLRTVYPDIVAKLLAASDAVAAGGDLRG